MHTINAGEALLIYLGTPVSTNGEYVEVSVVFDGMSFVNFDEDLMELSIDQGVTTNEETGIYSIEITLTEETDELEETYTLRLTVVETAEDPSVECAAVEELVCYIETIEEQEIETCECQLLCQPRGLQSALRRDVFNFIFHQLLRYSL